MRSVPVAGLNIVDPLRVDQEIAKILKWPYLTGKGLFGGTERYLELPRALLSQIVSNFLIGWFWMDRCIVTPTVTFYVRMVVLYIFGSGNIDPKMGRP
jgi:hypothetical protein